MFRAGILLLTMHIVFSHNDKCVPQKSLQRKLCSVMDSNFHVLRVKVLRDLSSTPEENHRYKVRVIQRMNKMNEKSRNTKKSNKNRIFRALFKILAPKRILRDVEIPRECTLTLQKKYILIVDDFRKCSKEAKQSANMGKHHCTESNSAQYDRNSERIYAGCNDLLEWGTLTGFQKGRLRHGGYRCGVEICFNDCDDNGGCGFAHVPLACRMERDDEDCYDKYAECKLNAETSKGDWDMQDSIFNSCQQMVNEIPVFTESSGTGNGTDLTAVP